MIRDIKKSYYYYKLKKILGYNVYYPIRNINSKNVLFVHIPKNAGTSIGPLIGFNERKHFSLDENGNPTKENIENTKGTLRHWDSKTIVKEIGLKKWESSYKFAFVRNPWERMFSWYSYKTKINHHLMRDEPIEFNDWIEAVFGDNPSEKYMHSKRMYQSQFDWLSLDGESIAVDFVGRVENINEDFKTLAEVLGIKEKLKHSNRSDKGNYTEIYNRKSIDLIEKHFKKDIEYWGYGYGK